MEDWEPFIRKIIELLGFRDYALEVDNEHRHGSAFIHDDSALVRDNLPNLIESINHLIQLVARKKKANPFFLDINNYRHERETLIVELARATARKAVATKTEIPLPVMNSYERRLAHTELSTRPDVMTESIGKGRGRYVVVKPILESTIEPKKDDPVDIK